MKILRYVRGSEFLSYNTSDYPDDLFEEAMNRWNELACGEYCDSQSDLEVNDLLQKVAGDKYALYDELDNPIWDIIHMLDEDELIEFIDGCDEIYSDLYYRKG